MESIMLFDAQGSSKPSTPAGRRTMSYYFFIVVRNGQYEPDNYHTLQPSQLASYNNLQYYTRRSPTHTQPDLFLFTDDKIVLVDDKIYVVILNQYHCVGACVKF